MAKELRAEENRATAKGLTTAELAFYDAVVQNASAMELGDETLRKIAQDLVVAIRGSASLDWRDHESVQAELRIKVKTLLKRYEYPPDGHEQATELVIEQAELFTEEMLAAYARPYAAAPPSSSITSPSALSASRCSATASGMCCQSLGRGNAPGMITTATIDGYSGSSSPWSLGRSQPM